ncbi:DUF1190 domain-containing protein [Glaciecola petra]|uniref:DUF1190 domain-containing protein n=1 Tax=Glaciecola petra TaxID=3075602 RepID=A0ABU2ZVG4_9ALTE|nr:DUF1190 domain-containing protein [Aestuariibacter sp. P117]MDT0596641.1 DUF1190 domain-containing protein [Aestuariibacter sp. P117]
MKRTSFLDLKLMRKRSRTFVLAPISLAVMAGCSSGPSEEEVKFVKSVAECESTTSLSEADCQAAYEQALKDAEATAPRYQYERDCENEFGNCQRTSSGFFVPFMAGYIVAEIIDEVGDSFERKHRYRHSYPTYLYSGSGSYRNKIMTSDGFVVGSPGQRSYRMPREALKPKPAVTRTISRGGFGSAASAKSNWGSAKSSRSSRGWGG